jgi:hypothetical protein
LALVLELSIASDGVVTFGPGAGGKDKDHGGQDQKKECETRSRHSDQSNPVVGFVPAW